MNNNDAGKNIGEWSELYVFLYTLGIGYLSGCNEHMQRLKNEKYPIVSIKRFDKSPSDYEFRYLDDSKEIDITIDKISRRRISRDEFTKMADTLYKELKLRVDIKKIKSKKKQAEKAQSLGINISDICASGSFKLPCSSEIMNYLELTSVSASSSSKADISITLHDHHNNFDFLNHFSIKSFIGQAPHIVNISGATVVKILIPGMTDEEMKYINGIKKNKKQGKIMRRCDYINSHFTLGDCYIKNTTFASNLFLIDTRCNEIIGEILKISYFENINRMDDIVNLLENRNPLNFPRTGVYSRIIKRLLTAHCLGMKPSKKWNGEESATGGFIFVAENGDVNTFYLYNRNIFENFLINSTLIDRGDSSRTGIGTIVKETTNGIDQYFFLMGWDVRYKDNL